MPMRFDQSLRMGGNPVQYLQDFPDSRQPFPQGFALVIDYRRIRYNDGHVAATAFAQLLSGIETTLNASSAHLRQIRSRSPRPPLTGLLHPNSLVRERIC